MCFLNLPCFQQRVWSSNFDTNTCWHNCAENLSKHFNPDEKSAKKKRAGSKRPDSSNIPCGQLSGNIPCGQSHATLCSVPKPNVVIGLDQCSHQHRDKKDRKAPFASVGWKLAPVLMIQTHQCGQAMNLTDNAANAEHNREFMHLRNSMYGT